MVLLNPYHDLFRALERYPEDLRLETRKKLIWAFSWAVPSSEAILELKEWGPLLEIGAGGGYWAWLLRQAGADVIAVDREPGQPPHWSRVEGGGPELAASYPERTLLLCWPPYRESMAFDALRGFSGSRVAYVGEMDGRTGDDRFHRSLREEFVLLRELEIPCWPGFSDRLRFFERKTF